MRMQNHQHNPRHYIRAMTQLFMHTIARQDAHMHAVQTHPLHAPSICMIKCTPPAAATSMLTSTATALQRTWSGPFSQVTYVRYTMSDIFHSEASRPTVHHVGHIPQRSKQKHCGSLQPNGSISICGLYTVLPGCYGTNAHTP